MSILIKPLLCVYATATAAQAIQSNSLHQLVPSGVPLNGASPSLELGFCPRIHPYSDLSTSVCSDLPNEEEPVHENQNIKGLCLEFEEKRKCCTYYTNTTQGIEIQQITADKTPEDLTSTMDIVNEYAYAFTNYASTTPEVLPLFSAFISYVGVPPHWENYFHHEQKNSRNPAYAEFLRQGTCNSPNEHQVTPIHRAAREADFDTLAYCLPKHSQDVLLRPESYFTNQTLADCSSVPTPLSELSQIPLNQFTYPFVVVQNQCNTLVSLKNGSLLTLKNVGALDIHNLLSKRYQESIGVDFVPTENTLQIYLNPGHGFFGLSCKSCDSSTLPFDKTIGFYPSNVPPSGTLCDEATECGGKSFSDENNYLKLVIPITDEQAKTVFQKITEIETSNPTYHLYLRNCLDVTQEIFQEISPGHFLSFFTSEQLHMLPVGSQPAIQYAIVEHQYYIPIRAIVTGFEKAFLTANLLLRSAVGGMLNPISQKILGISLFHSYTRSECLHIIPYMGSIVASSLALDLIKIMLGSGETIISLDKVLPGIGLLTYSLYDIAKAPSYTNSLFSKQLPYITQIFLSLGIGNLLAFSLQEAIPSAAALTKEIPDSNIGFIQTSNLGGLLSLGILMLLGAQQILNEFRAPIGNVYIQA